MVQMGGIQLIFLLGLIQREKKYSKATAFRMKTDSEPKLTQETGFHKKPSELTRNFIEYKGFWLANNFTKSGTIKEYTACRESAIATDLITS